MEMEWRPSGSVEALKKRADLVGRIREFFAERGVWEADTPILLHAVDTNPYVEPLTLRYDSETLYLQTSPEFAMKRLLAAGSGSIYQLCKSFRTEELGRYHNPEFTMLEWYRVGFDHRALMREVDALLQCVLGTPAADHISYREMFLNYLGFDPHRVSVEELRTCAEREIGEVTGLSEQEKDDPDTWLQLLFSECIEPKLGHERPVLMYDYPASQASLSQIRSQEDPPVAERFEAYVKGVQLANGFHELADPIEQRKRFEAEQKKRLAMGLPPLKIDDRFIASLGSGFPDCAGVALGIDRLMMLALGKTSIKEVLSFSFEHI